MTPTAKETALEERVAELENVLAQLIRATYAAVITQHGPSQGWTAWQRAGAPHQAMLDLHAYLQRHPAPEQD